MAYLHRSLWLVTGCVLAYSLLDCTDDGQPGEPAGGSAATTSTVGGGAGTTTTTTPPSVGGFSGSLVDGEDFTIEGRGFGDKSPVEPWIWDTFEDGTPGTDVEGWQLWSDDGFPAPRITDVDCASGSRCAELNFEDHQAHNALLAYHAALHEQMFGSIRYKVVKTGGFDSRNIKLFRLMGTMSGDPVHGTPVIAWGGQDSSSPLDPADPEPYDELNSWMIASSGSETCSGPSRMYAGPERDVWHAIAQWIVLSQPDGAANGTLGRRLDGDFQQEQDVTKCADSTSDGLDEVAIGLYLAHDRDVDVDGDGQGDGWDYVQSDYRIYVDDVYVDTTLARVEICDSPSWEQGSCQVQIPHTTWNNTTIVLEAHQGPMPAGVPLYLFVVNAAGIAGEPIEVRFD